MPQAETAATGRLPKKRQAIFDAALAVFAREGYAHASIDAISTEADVSTRTIYNHFPNKAALFQAVVEETTAKVAKAQIEIIDHHLRDIVDLESDLIEFGKSLAAPMKEHAEHFAVVRQMNAETAHIPPAAVDAWQEAGPLHVQRELARRMRRLGEAGLLEITDPERAAVHFMLLVQGAASFHHGVGATRESRVSEIVTSGVRAFLYGYLP